MTSRYILFCLVFALISCKQTPKDTVETTYYFIRHAEKDRTDPTNRNPELTEAGHERSRQWAIYFKDIPLDAVYSTDYKRTTYTAVQTAISKGLEVQLYDPRNLNDSTFVANTAGKTVLVVGHSNTTPAFVNAVLDEAKYEDIDDTNNGNIYTVQLYTSGIKTDAVQRIEPN